MNLYLYFLSTAGIEVLSGAYAETAELEKAMRLEDHRRISARATPPVPGTLLGVDISDEAYYQLNSEGLMINIGRDRGRDMIKQTLATILPALRAIEERQGPDPAGGG